MELLHTPASGAQRAHLVLAHGAGAGMRSPFMENAAQGLCARGVQVTRFEFPYMAARARGGARRPPDPQPKLAACYREVVEALGGAATLVIGGKSLGGRVASSIADELGARGLVCLGYPFHPAGKPERLRTAHLETLRTRTLIVQGTRDPLGDQAEVCSYGLSERIELYWVQDGDHSLVPRRKLGHDPKAALEAALDRVARFVIGLSKRPSGFV